jgi:hypothetical protein
VRGPDPSAWSDCFDVDAFLASSGTAVRFEPGETKSVTLVAIGGKNIVYGGSSLSTGPLDLSKWDEILHRITAQGFAHVEEPSAKVISEDNIIPRETCQSRAFVPPHAAGC